MSSKREFSFAARSFSIACRWCYPQCVAVVFTSPFILRPDGSVRTIPLVIVLLSCACMYIGALKLHLLTRRSLREAEAEARREDEDQRTDGGSR